MISASISCGYLENDHIDYSQAITGRYELQKQANSEDVNLVFKEYDNSGSIILNKCIQVFYDSAQKSIYVESYLNQYNQKFSKVEILEPSGHSSKAYSLKSISKEFFDSIYNRNTFNRLYKF